MPARPAGQSYSRGQASGKSDVVMGVLVTRATIKAGHLGTPDPAVSPLTEFLFLAYTFPQDMGITIIAAL